MFGETFYHSTIRKYVAMFGTLFDDITITRRDDSGNVTQTFKVPLAYGPSQKFLARIEQDPDLKKQIAMQLPRMSFELMSMTYDSSRMLNKSHRRPVGTSTASSRQFQYSPVPYNFLFSLNIISKNIEDGSKIIEQILPYFRPNVNMSAKLLQDSEIDDSYDISVGVTNINTTDQYEGNFVQGRPIIWELNFIMKGYLFTRISSGKIIKTAYVNLYTDQIGLDADLPDETMTVTPYLEGTDPSNILPTDDYGFTVEIDMKY